MSEIDRLNMPQSIQRFEQVTILIISLIAIRGIFMILQLGLFGFGFFVLIFLSFSIFIQAWLLLWVIEKRSRIAKWVITLITALESESKVFHMKHALASRLVAIRM
ncbi:hypothetical protein [Parvularcula sp. IMCC14364]|uniref:hypothetical protein n=1 Tax=Parvularcula sp. IMCC14364 TaxID=3067902 RepID=UPI00274047E7|nr:hypothetical protein [Parvularcula sp. IMCC14364]